MGLSVPSLKESGKNITIAGYTIKGYVYNNLKTIFSLETFKSFLCNKLPSLKSILALPESVKENLEETKEKNQKLIKDLEKTNQENQKLIKDLEKTNQENQKLN